jgi:hypothetical protein
MVKKSKTDMKSDARVHYNSSKPAEVGALAYITPGDKYSCSSRAGEALPHEAWYVMQQAQERVKPTMQFRLLLSNTSHAICC